METEDRAQPTATNRKQVVMISSTARDLPDHRDAIKEACLRQGMFPSMMEHLPASDSDAIATSLRMVDEADLYLGVFAYRYGYIPRGSSISITEMEYNRAVERGIPRLLFLIDRSHPILFSDVEQGEGATKLQTLKNRLEEERVVNYFTSPLDLQSKVINSLSQYRESNLTAFHYVSDIPQPPKEYVAHPYTLLQTPSLIGRQQELNLLTDWVTRRDSSLYTARILSIVAIGGMGKSALTWKWFHDIAPQEMRRLSGRMWWSFYESDASFDHFVTRALAYVSKRPRKEIQSLPAAEREAQLLAILDQEPYLIVMDGLERILLAYARMDASRLQDDDLDQRTANRVTGALGLPASAAQSFIGQNQLRKTTDPHVGNFLRKLAGVRASRILISTRLYPADLQTEIGSERPGCKAVFLPGLSDDDALNLWRALGMSGSRETLLPLFHSFGNHPLLIQVLAGAISRDRRTPGDFDGWYKNHPEFNPFQLSLIQAQSHVLVTALEGLSEAAQRVLFTIAAFRMPTSYDTLTALFLGEDKLFDREDELVRVLAELEDRGLLGWDRRANRYDQHPIVRGITWDKLNQDTKQDIQESLNKHFSSLPTVDDDEVNSLDDLAATIELYYVLLGLGRLADAISLFIDRLAPLLVGKLSMTLQGKEMLKVLISRVQEMGDQWSILNVRIDYPKALNSEMINDINKSVVLSLLALFEEDRPGRAANAYRQMIELEILASTETSSRFLVFCVFCAESWLLSVSIYEAQMIILQAAQQFQTHQSGYDEMDKAYVFSLLGLIFAARGKREESENAFERAFTFMHEYDGQEDMVHDDYAMQSLWLSQYMRAYDEAQKAENVYRQNPVLGRLIRAIRLQGQAALALGKISASENLLQDALARSRSLNQVAEELPARVALAELRRRQGDYKGAREFLDDFWEAAERGPFRLYHADACNVLAQIERDEGNHQAAVKAATDAYRLAWYDGPPYAYHWGLEAAKAHLAALGAPEPALPPFDMAGREPIPEINLDDV